MAEDMEPGESPGRSRARTSHRDLITAAAKAGGREGAREVLIPLGIDISNAESIERFHAERAFTRNHMLKTAERDKWVRKALVTFFMTIGLGGFAAWIRSTLHISEAGH